MIMNKSYLVLKIIFILAALIAVGYLFTPVDGRIILERPWFR